MAVKRRRLSFFVHSSSQGKYIALSVLPVVLLSLFCIFFVFDSVEDLMMDVNERPMVPVAKVQRTASYIAQAGHDAGADQKMIELGDNLHEVQRVLEDGHRETLVEWNRIKIGIYLVLFVGLFASGSLALIYSHRTVGPLTRIRNNIGQMADGRQIPPVRLRKHDEFKELADSLDRLRERLTDIGFLE